MAHESADPKQTPSAAVPLDEDQLDQVSGGSGTYYCKTHGKPWPCPVIVNGGACPGPKYMPILV